MIIEDTGLKHTVYANKTHTYWSSVTITDERNENFILELTGCKYLQFSVEYFSTREGDIGVGYVTLMKFDRRGNAVLQVPLFGPQGSAKSAKPGADLRKTAVAWYKSKLRDRALEASHIYTLRLNNLHA